MLVLTRSAFGLFVVLCLQAIWWEDRSEIWLTVGATLIGWGIGDFFYLSPLWSLLLKALRGAR